MTPNSDTINTATDVLIRYGREQYEDSAVYNAVAQYVDGIGRIPDAAWGQLPWSARWRERWEKGLDHRVAEARLMYEHTAEHSAAVLKAAADYTNTDIQVALNFDLKNQYIGPYVAAYSGTPDSTGVYRPGTGGSTPIFGRSTVFQPPASLPEFRALNAERLPGTLPYCTESNPTGADLKSGVSRDALDDFVERYGEDLLCAEYVAAHYGSGGPRPFTDHILPAWYCVPGIIRNRAELLHQAVATYKECAAMMEEDIARVRDHWFSPGAALAWFRQASSHRKYLVTITEELRWFADQGITAAELLEGLRNKYADLGHQRVKQIIELAKAVTRAHFDVLGGIGDCTSNPVKALSNALSGFVEVLYLEMNQRHDMALGLISIDEQRRREQGDPGTLAHSTVPFPEVEDGESLWSNGKDWVPNRATGPVAGV